MVKDTHRTTLFSTPRGLTTEIRVTPPFHYPVVVVSNEKPR